MVVTTIGVAGHVCVDLTPAVSTRDLLRPGDIVEVGDLVIAAGGCVGNTGLALRTLGADVRIAAAVGTDPLGRMLLDHFERRGVDTSSVAPVHDRQTSYSVVVQPPADDRTIWHHVGSNASFDGLDVDLSACDLVHLGYPSLLPAMIADDGAALLRWLRRRRTEGATSSIDLAVIDPASPAATLDWRRLIERAAPLIDVLSPSLDDLRSAFGLAETASLDLAARLADHLVAAGVAVVAISAGALGLAIATADVERLQRGGRVLAPLAGDWADRRLRIEVPRVARPATTNGAGDVSTAALLRALDLGLGPDAAGAFATSVAAKHVAGEPLVHATPQMRSTSTPHAPALRTP